MPALPTPIANGRNLTLAQLRGLRPSTHLHLRLLQGFLLFFQNLQLLFFQNLHLLRLLRLQ